MSKISNIIILFLKYPLLFIKDNTLKNEYLKIITTIINKINGKTDINIINKEVNLEIEYFVAMHKVAFEKNEVDYFLFLIQFISYIEILSKNNNNQPYYKLDLFDFVIFDDSKNLETNIANAQVYSNDLNRELDRITLDVSILLKTIKGLKSKLSSEEIKTELLTAEKGVLKKKLAKEKRKTKKTE